MTLTEIDKLSTENMIEQGYSSGDQVKADINLLKEKYDGIRGKQPGNRLTDEEKALLGELDKDVQAVYEKTIFSNQKAYLLFFKAMVYDAATKVMFSMGGGATVVPENTEETETTSKTEALLNEPLGYSIDSDGKYILQEGEATKFYITQGSDGINYIYYNGKTFRKIFEISNKVITVLASNLDEPTIFYDDDTLIYHELTNAEIDLEKKTITVKSS